MSVGAGTGRAAPEPLLRIGTHGDYDPDAEEPAHDYLSTKGHWPDAEINSSARKLEDRTTRPAPTD